jgi:hypothetical protein
MLTLSILNSKFQKQNPHGSITEQKGSKYDVCFDTRDNRTESEKELDMWQSTADTRKIYTYRASNLFELAEKLHIDVTEYIERSKLNQDFEQWLKEPESEDDEPLFFE